MVKKIRLLGMEIDNYSLPEEVLLGEEYINKSELNIIRTVSMKMLSMAADNQAVRAGIQQADLLIIGNREILLEAGIRSSQRLWEASEHGFMQEYLKCMCRDRRRVFLLASDSSELEILQEYLKQTYEKIQIVGSYILDNGKKDFDKMINEINAIVPDVILSVLDFLQEEEFLPDAREKIDAKVWYSLGDQYQEPERKQSFLVKLQRLFYRGRFKNIIHNYREYNE